MATLTFDVTSFRQQFPVFADTTAFPDAMLQMYWDMATSYISTNGSYGALQGVNRQLALNFMTAHLTALSVVVAGGQIPGLVIASTIDKISVTLMAPPVKNQWQWWLSLTPYGQSLLALLQVTLVGGKYLGGFPTLAAYRR